MGFLLSTDILIQAAPEKIWTILTDFKNYPDWNPFITSLTGDFKVGKKIKVTIQLPEADINKFNATVSSYKINEKMSWLGVLITKGIFGGEHTFEITDNGNKTATLVQSEKFTGILVPLFKKKLNNNVRRGFEAMNRKVKELAEK